MAREQNEEVKVCQSYTSDAGRVASPNHAPEGSREVVEASAGQAEGPAYPSTQPFEKQRYLPLDTYRGLIMILLVSDGFGFGRLINDPIFHAIANQFSHRPWGGAVFMT